MLYENLNQLINNSSGTREYFLSLPIELQLQLHNQSEYIHSASELRLRVQMLHNYNHAVEISGRLF